ncbi:MAG: DUF721 domain-containing protein [Ignavibacterium sp.]|nr:DUF721 domain-containing protein [Ignavibacterium sp.]
MPDGFKSLKEVFNKEPELKKIRDVVKSSDIVNDFNKIFPDLKKIVTGVKTNKSTLIIKIENPVWRQELKHREENIIKKINSFYNEERIKQIRFS